MKTLLYNGKIWIGKNYFADSTGIDSETGKIIFVGKGKKDDNNVYGETIDLKGKLVLPAFTDGHCHLFKGAMVNSEINLRYSSTRKEFSDTILNYKNCIKKDEWIAGGYFSEANFTENIIINREFIDDICSDVPVVLFRTDLHSVVCNTLALEKINIINHSKEFTDDEIIRDGNNNLTGELKEKAMYFAVNALPAKSIDEKKDILKRQIMKLHSYGIASVTDMSWREDLDVYKSLLGDNNMTLKINSVIPFEEIDSIQDFKNEFSDYKNYIRFGALKAFYDGSLSSHTALFSHNYKGKNNNGIRTEQVTSGRFKELAHKIDKTSCQIVVHVIGDLAVSEVLDVIEEIRNVNPLWDRRVRLEHIQHIHDKDLYRFKMLDVISSVQPAHLFFDAKVATECIENPETTHVFKKLADKGNRLCFGTDFPVVPENPFENIYFALTREAIGFPEGFNTEMCLNLITCLESYTMNNAYASFEEYTKGSIREGKFADLIVIDRDIFSINAKEIKNAAVEITFINGNIVYKA